jgi:hypothetical protein
LAGPLVATQTADRDSGQKRAPRPRPNNVRQWHDTQKGALLSVDEARRIMRERNVQYLLVLDANLRLVGVTTIKDSLPTLILPTESSLKAHAHSEPRNIFKGVAGRQIFEAAERFSLMVSSRIGPVQAPTSRSAGLNCWLCQCASDWCC